LTLFSMEKHSMRLVMTGLFLLSISSSGVLGVIGAESTDVLSHGGWIGYGISQVFSSIFGFWVSEIIMTAGIAVSVVTFWHIIPHPRLEEDEEGSLTSNIKKIFEPKFKVESIDSEPKVNPLEPLESPKESKRKDTEQSPQLLPLNPSQSFLLPPLNLLEAEKGAPNAGDIAKYSAAVKKTLQNFGIPVEMSEVNIGPAVTQYAFKPAEGVKLSRITALSNDLALALAAHPIRIEAPIPGRSLVGLEIPNKVRAIVRLRSLMEQSDFQKSQAPLLLSLGRDVSGKPIMADLARMPHLLVAGATGAGKTIALNNVILSLIYRNTPDMLRFILVDPKRVEFPVYNDLPHLLTPVILDTQRTINVLKWTTKEMERRFQLFSEHKVRDIAGYHAIFAEEKSEKKKGDEEGMETIPYIVLVIDELADLMMARGKEIEGMIVRLAQMARAVGIHLVIATQRPSVEVITGLIKANITSRVAFQVASQIDSRTILDAAGAEKLLGQGDMLFVSAEFTKPRRIQGAYVSEKEVRRVTAWLAKEGEEIEHTFIDEEELTQSTSPLEGFDTVMMGSSGDDPLFDQAKQIVTEAHKASASLLQRRLKIGYARAARLLDILENKGIVGPGEGAKPREVYGVFSEESKEEEEPSV
ncbi:MAG: DNA translocase FtsK, partial [bacterium]|nr:DNA translocase FtsK [bacterium]